MDNTAPNKHLFKQIYEIYFLDNQHKNASQSKTSFNFIAIKTQFDLPIETKIFLTDFSSIKR